MQSIKKSIRKNFINYLGVLLLFLTALNLISVIIYNREKFLSRYDHEKMGEIYSQSQYVRGPAATAGIGDDGLFAVAGYYLLLQGGDPTQIHFESPPAGEYLIGLSILIFKNERVISLVYGLFFLIYTYKLALLLFKKRIIGSLAVLIISLSPLFHSHLIASQLDLPQGLFILLGVFYFIKALYNQPIFFFLSSLFFGLAVSTKFFPGIIFFILILIIWALKAKVGKRKLILMFTSFLLIPLIYLCCYLMFFYYHPSLSEFIKFHKWVIKWRLGNPIVFGNIFLSMLIGRYRSWWQNGLWLTNNEWNLLQPIILLGSLFSVFITKLRRINGFKYLYSILILFLLYVSVGTTGINKYIYPIYPLMVIFTSYSILYLFKLLRW